METLFATLFKEYKPLLTPVLLEMVRETEEACDTSDMSVLLKKDACKSLDFRRDLILMIRITA